MIKTLKNPVLEGIHLNVVKYNKPTGNIIQSGEKLKPLSLKSGTRQGCPQSYSIYARIGGQSNKARERYKAIQIGKKEVKFSLFPDEMILYLKEPRLHQKLLDLINTFGKIAGNNINI
jgi:hypothetical protein